MSALAEAARRTKGRVAGMAGPGWMAGAHVHGPVLERSAAVLLASEGREFSSAAIRLAAELADEHAGPVQVMSIARVHGTAFGFQTPGLMPTKAEWEEQRQIVDRAVKKLRRQGVEAEGQVLGTRSPAKRICARAGEIGADAIVMGADPDRGWVLGSMMWSQEPQHVERRAKRVAVHLAASPAA